MEGKKGYESIFCTEYEDLTGKRENNTCCLYYKYISEEIGKLKVCSEEEFSVLILITGSSKAFVEMAITEDQAPEKS